MTALTYDQVMEKLPAIVAECLAIEPEEVTPEMPFCEESIEYLNLSFACERAFGIKSPFRLFVGSRDLLTMDEAGRLSPDSLNLIRSTYPFFAEKFDATGQTQWQLSELKQFFTVDMIARFVVHASAQQSSGANPEGSQPFAGGRAERHPRMSDTMAPMVSTSGAHRTH